MTIEEIFEHEDTLTKEQKKELRMKRHEGNVFDYLGGWGTALYVTSGLSIGTTLGISIGGLYGGFVGAGVSALAILENVEESNRNYYCSLIEDKIKNN